MDNLCMLFVITDYTNESKFLKIINKYKVGFKTVMYGKGTASDSILDYFELDKEEKSIITLVLPVIVCKNILKEIKERTNVNEHGRGIAFSISLSSGSKYMLDFYKKHEMEDVEMEDIKQHLIITITNEGYAEKVMSEAKKAGATGGTTINGRGLNNKTAIKFLKINIEPEKDIVLILASSESKNKIMESIIRECGIKTPGGGICFSLPVDYAVGLNKELTC